MLVVAAANREMMRNAFRPAIGHSASAADDGRLDRPAGRAVRVRILAQLSPRAGGRRRSHRALARHPARARAQGLPDRRARDRRGRRGPARHARRGDPAGAAAPAPAPEADRRRDAAIAGDRAHRSRRPPARLEPARRVSPDFNVGDRDYFQAQVAGQPVPLSARC